VKVILVSQGRTAWDDEKRVQGTIDVPLSERGRKESAALARKLVAFRPRRIYSGTGQTQLETARILARTLGCGITRLAQLNALDQGLWQGALHAELAERCRRSYRRWRRGPQRVSPPQGESTQTMIARVAEVVAMLRRRRRSGTVVLVLPDVVRLGAQALLAGVRLETLWSASPRAAAWTGIDI